VILRIPTNPRTEEAAPEASISLRVVVPLEAARLAEQVDRRTLLRVEKQPARAVVLARMEAAAVRGIFIQSQSAIQCHLRVLRRSLTVTSQSRTLRAFRGWRE